MNAKPSQQETFEQQKQAQKEAVRREYKQPKLESLGTWTAVTMQLSGGLGAGF